MTTQELFDLTADNIIARISNTQALATFAKRRSKFEGWLKVELIDVLIRNGFNALPEVGFIDVSFGHVAIELKTVNTNIRYTNAGVIDTIRPITKNVQSVVKDIEKLRTNADTDLKDKFVVFVVFPIEHDNTNWQVQLKRITDNLEDVIYQEFRFFSGDVPGVIYYGKVGLDAAQSTVSLGSARPRLNKEIEVVGIEAIAGSLLILMNPKKSRSLCLQVSLNGQRAEPQDQLYLVGQVTTFNAFNELSTEQEKENAKLLLEQKLTDDSVRLINRLLQEE